MDAVRALGAHTQLAQLRPLLSLDEDEDPDDDLLADTIEALYPDLLTTGDLLEALRPRRNYDLVGGYGALLESLGEAIPDADLRTALEWLAEQISDDAEAYGGLPEQLIERGWSQSDSEPISDALAAVLGQAAHSHASIDLITRRTPPWADAGDKRRRLAVAVAERLDPDRAWLDLLDLRLTSSDDATWLLDALPHVAELARPALAACLPQLVHDPTAELADRILMLTPDHPACEATAHLRADVALDSEAAQRWRRHRAIQSEDRPDPVSPEHHRELLLNALTEAEDDVDQWWKIVYWLSLKGRRVRGEALFSHDLTRRPGWPLLDENEHERVISVGLQHVASHELEPSPWRGQKTINSVDALRDWAGIYLLTTLARHDPQRVRHIDPAVWVRLAPAIVGAWNFDHDADTNLRVQLIRLAPSQARPHIEQAALDELDAAAAGGRSLPPYPLYEDFINDIAQPLSDRLLAGRYPHELGTQILDLLSEHAPDVAITTSRALGVDRNSELTAAGARHLARLDAPSILEDLLTAGPSDQAVLEVVPHLNMTDFDASQLGQLASPGDPPRQLRVRRRPRSRDPHLHRRLQRVLRAVHLGQDRRRDPRQTQASNNFSDGPLVPCQATFARLTMSWRARSWALRLRQAM